MKSNALLSFSKDPNYADRIVKLLKSFNKALSPQVMQLIADINDVSLSKCLRSLQKQGLIVKRTERKVAFYSLNGDVND